MPFLAPLPAPPTLDEDTIDDLLYLARTSSLPDLRATLAELSQTHSCPESAVLLAAQDPQSGNTPAHLAAANGHADVLRFLGELASTTGSNGTVTNGGTDNAHADATTALSLALLAPRNGAGSTPLHYAAVNAALEAVKAIVEGVPQGDARAARADLVRAKNDAGRDAATEAEAAEREGWEEVVGFLLGSVDDPNGEGEDAPPGEEVGDAEEADTAAEELDELDVKKT